MRRTGPTLSMIAILLALVLSASAIASGDVQRVEGGIVRGPTHGRKIALVFTGHEYAEGATTILDALADHQARASFFLTGAFLRNPEFAAHVRRMVADGHYVGPHSDAHLLYCPWTGPKVTLVTRGQFTSDLERNIDALRPFGVPRQDVRYFLPAYEWYNAEIVEWSRALGLTLVNYTPGTRSNADYTEEGTRQFVDSATILDSILRREREDPHGLNGFILLLHIGAGPKRADKFHRHFDALLDRLAARGYQFVTLDRLLLARP